MLRGNLRGDTDRWHSSADDSRSLSRGSECVRKGLTDRRQFSEHDSRSRSRELPKLRGQLRGKLRHLEHEVDSRSSSQEQCERATASSSARGSAMQLRSIMAKYADNTLARASWTPKNSQSGSSKTCGRRGNLLMANSLTAGTPALDTLFLKLRSEGAAVCLNWKGHYLNGQVGRLSSQLNYDGSAAKVVLSTCLGNPEISVPSSVIQELEAGAIVEIVEEARKAFDRAGGRVVGFAEDVVGYSVRLPKSPDATGFMEGEWSSGMGARLASLEAVELRPHRIFGMPFTGDGAFGHGAEHPCQFIDDDCRVQKFFFYLPRSFDLSGRCWPLLLFLHGSAGGTVVGSRLKAQAAGRSLKNAPGVDFAAENFVMVCPKCNWKWDGTPDVWVLQLVKFLLPAVWCDVSRVYCTGLSMGGMACWELAAGADGLFTAVAPVGAYHKRERREHIARGLRGTPVFVVQAPADKYCPMASEAELWEDLSKLGNAPVVKQHVPGGHGDLFKQAYSRDTQLWEWLLAQECHVLT